MKRASLAISAALTFAAHTAQAADMALKAPPPPAPIYSWTGWYAGLNAGGGWQNTTIDNSVTSNFSGGAGLFPALNAAVPQQFDTHPRGFIGGGQIGYNYQFAPKWLAGLEADFQGAHIKGSAGATNAVLDAGTGLITITGTGSQTMGWFGTLRGRLGWLPADPLLLYATGGLAYGRVETAVSFLGTRVNTPGGNAIPLNGFIANSQAQNRAGWTLGGGLEWMFAPRWTAKAEYLYYDLGAETLNQPLSLTGFVPGIGTVGIGANIQSVSHFRGNIARVGVNYELR
jgi:outer membrane immunogenic protein